jgi:arylsulfatase A-like enzyme
MQPDILLVICDTARADAFRPWGGQSPSPTLERLVQQGTAYANATTQAPWTLPSTASIMSGKLPTQHGIHNDCLDWSGESPTSPAAAVRAVAGEWLPESLRERGYTTWAASCNQWITPWGGFDRGFDEFHDTTDRVRLPRGQWGRYVRKAGRLYGKFDRGGKAVTTLLARKAGSTSADQPMFAFMNLMECHSPYDPPRPFYPYAPWKRPETFKMSGGGKGPRKFLVYNLGVERPSGDYVTTLRTLYRQCARYVDWLLGRVVRVVEERGRPAVVVVVSDHGENLGDHGLFGHNSSLNQTLLHVPLVTWGHKVDLASGWVQDNAALTGLAPWLRGIADGTMTPMAGNGPVITEYESTTRWIPADVQARLDATGKADSVPPLVYHAGFAVRDGSMKYIALETGAESLFDLADDPDEERDLAAVRPEEVLRLRPHRDAWQRRRAEQPTYEAGDVADQEISEHLRQLGYIE